MTGVLLMPRTELVFAQPSPALVMGPSPWNVRAHSSAPVSAQGQQKVLLKEMRYTMQPTSALVN